MRTKSAMNKFTFLAEHSRPSYATDTAVRWLCNLLMADFVLIFGHSCSSLGVLNVHDQKWWTKSQGWRMPHLFICSFKIITSFERKFMPSRRPVEFSSYHQRQNTHDRWHSSPHTITGITKQLYTAGNRMKSNMCEQFVRHCQHSVHKSVICLGESPTGDHKLQVQIKSNLFFSSRK